MFLIVHSHDPLMLPVVNLKGAGFSDTLSIIAGGADARRTIESFLARPPADAVLPGSSVRLLAPIPRPPKIICIGLNYRDHAIESDMDIPKVPTAFSKYATSVIGPEDRIVLPKASQKPDYEAEFAIVIGKGAVTLRRINGSTHVFGYMNLNDVSARDFQMATTQWMMGKTFDTFCPTGPWLVTADEIADPHNLDIQIAINGEVLQKSNTQNLIFRIPDLISYLSTVFTLEPGDIISTGTPSGVGFARKPPRWLAPGDDVVVSVQGLGDLRSRVVAE